MTSREVFKWYFKRAPLPQRVTRHQGGTARPIALWAYPCKLSCYPKNPVSLYVGGQIKCEGREAIDEYDRQSENHILSELSEL